MTKSKTNNRSVSVASAVLSVKDPSGISPPCYFVTLNKRSPVNDETLPPAATKRTKADTISTCKKSVVNSYEDIDLVTGRLPDDYVEVKVRENVSDDKDVDQTSSSDDDENSLVPAIKAIAACKQRRILAETKH